MQSLTFNASALLLFTDLKAAHLPLALLLVFGTAKLFANVCERFGQPSLVGEIIAGVLLGPSVLHWIPSNDGVLNALAEMGAMFLLFRVGLEIKASELLRIGKELAFFRKNRHRMRYKEPRRPGLPHRLRRR